MKQTACAQPKVFSRSTFVAVGLGLVFITGPAFAEGHCITLLNMTHLKGKIYTELPKNLCPSYTDMLLGQTAQQQEYGGVICDRPEASYILLQRLVKQDQQGKAVWQIVQVKSVVKPNAQSLILGVGCQQQDHNAAAPEPIFALVQPTNNNTYQTISAWIVNLDKAAFSVIEPKKVVCKDFMI